MSYDTDATGTWCFLVGLYPNEKKEILSHIQLYNTEKKVTMPLEGYTACFADMPVTDAPGNPKNALFCFCERKANEAHQTLRITEIGNPPAGQAKFKTECQIQLAQDAPGDFPIFMQAANKYGLIFMITKAGYLYLYEASKGSLVYRQRITDQLIIASTRNNNTDGMICINKTGQVIAINIDADNLVKYVMGAQHVPDNKTVAFKLASRFGLGGADETFVQQFNMCLAQGDFAGAARVARDAPPHLLRTQETIDKFKQMQPAAGQQKPIMLYFSTLLESGTKLNETESLELARPVLQSGKMNLIEDWMNKGQLTQSDKLGDLLRQYNPQMALKVFQASGSQDKVVQGLIEAN